MSVLAVVQNHDQVDQVLPLAMQFCVAQETNLAIYCLQFESAAESGDAQKQAKTSLQEATKHWLDKNYQHIAHQSSDEVSVHCSNTSKSTSSIVDFIRADKTQLLVTMVNEPDSEVHGSDPGHLLLRNSPCDTVLLYRGNESIVSPDRVFVGTAENTVSDQLLVVLAANFCVEDSIACDIVKYESDPGSNAKEVGRRELKNLLKLSGIKKHHFIRSKVLLQKQETDFLKLANQADIAFVSSNSKLLLQKLLRGTQQPAVAAIKKAPPLRDWRSFWLSSFLSPLTPASYGDLIHGLRRDSRISEDFLVMLGLAASIASVGLLQDSAAVVIGSMLLAPLMTPMIGCGLAAAQANPNLGRTSLKTIAIGFILTLVISFCIGRITPGTELTSQILARGVPNILDLIVALFSGSAAAFALARPNIAGAVAGVAIATALVPPLCSAGISLAYFEFQNAIGAGILFIVNVVAIILSAAFTFRLLGVTSVRVTRWQRQWVFRLLTILLLILMVLAYPLLNSLQQELIKGRPIPNLYPLSAEVLDSVVRETEKHAGVQLIASGRPVSTHDDADVVLFLSGPDDVDPGLGELLSELVRQITNDDTLRVEVHCLRNVWSLD